MLVHSTLWNLAHILLGTRYSYVSSNEELRGTQSGSRYFLIFESAQEDCKPPQAWSIQDYGLFDIMYLTNCWPRGLNAARRMSGRALLFTWEYINCDEAPWNDGESPLLSSRTRFMPRLCLCPCAYHIFQFVYHLSQGNINMWPRFFDFYHATSTLITPQFFTASVILVN